MKFWASVRLEVRRGDALKVGAEQIGCRTKVKVVKNKVAPPFRTAEFDMIFGKGISKAGDVVDIGALRGMINRAGTYYNYGDIRLGQGRDNARTFLEQNPAVYKEIDDKIRAVFDAERAAAPVSAVVDVDEDEPEE